MKCILVRYSEIGIKGKRVRASMEKRLVENIRDCLKRNKIKFEKIVRKRGRIIVYSEYENAVKELRRVFGIVNLSIAEEMELDMKKIIDYSKNLVEKNQKFRVTAQRLDKTFKMTSQEVNIEVGAAINKKGGIVNLEDFDVNVGIEIMKENAYVFDTRINAVGGMPVGTQGKILAVIKNDRDIAACIQMMKRGSEPILYVIGNISYEKIKDFSWGIELKVEKDKKIDFNTINQIVEKEKCTAVSRGDSIKRVNMWKQFDSNISVPVLRPISTANY